MAEFVRIRVRSLSSVGLSSVVCIHVCIDMYIDIGPQKLCRYVCRDVCRPVSRRVLKGICARNMCVDIFAHLSTNVC